jgi:Transcription factor WhiB
VAGVNPETFAIARGQSPEAAFANCKRCDVIVECLDYALDLGQHAFGVWGHTTGRQRREAKRRGWNAERLLAELDGHGCARQDPRQRRLRRHDRSRQLRRILAGHGVSKCHAGPMCANNRRTRYRLGLCCLTS